MVPTKTSSAEHWSNSMISKDGVKKLLGYYIFDDMEGGNDEENWEFDSLADTLADVLNRLEKIETQIAAISNTLKEPNENQL